MRVTLTLSSSEIRDHAEKVLRTAPDRTRITFEDTEASEPQQIKLRLMLAELARRTDWHGEKLKPADWRVMFLAALRSTHVVHGLVPGTRVVLFERRSDEPSIEEASQLIELLYQFAAERGFEFNERT